MGESNNRLRQARAAAGFKHATDAARRFHWNPTTYASHENGQTPVPVKAAAKYADKFKNCSAAWILTGEGEGPTANAIQSGSSAASGKSSTGTSRSQELDERLLESLAETAIRVALALLPVRDVSSGEVSLWATTAVRSFRMRLDAAHLQDGGDRQIHNEVDDRKGRTEPERQ